MKIKLFTIPNILTLSNLVCGSIALIEILLYQNFMMAFILILISAAFDFLDGLAARLLGQYSLIGRELDSLADVVSFGLVPSIAMYCLMMESPMLLCDASTTEYLSYSTLFIACCSALRLAKFNVSSEQQREFIGLPTPANAMLCLSLAALASSGQITLYGEFIVAIALVMSLLMIAPIKLFALKFSSLSWGENKVRYIFLMIAAATLIIFRAFAIPIIIAVYILTSVVNNIVCAESKATK